MNEESQTLDAEAEAEAEVMVEQHIEPTATDVGFIEITETANAETAEPQIITTPDVEEIPSCYAVLSR